MAALERSLDEFLAFVVAREGKGGSGLQSDEQVVGVQIHSTELVEIAGGSRRSCGS